MKIINSVVVSFLMLFVLFANSVYAAQCTTRETESLARNLATREDAYIKLQIALAQVEVEIAYQNQLTATLESKYSQFPANSYVESVRPIMREKIDKEFERAKKQRTREATRALEKKQRAVQSAQKKYERAYNKVGNQTCTL